MPDDVRAMLDELEELGKMASPNWQQGHGGYENFVESGDDYTIFRPGPNNPLSEDDAELAAAMYQALPTLLRLARRAGEMEEAAREVLSAAHLRTHGFPEGDISDLDFSKMLPAIVRLDAALANLKEQGHD